MNRRVSDVVRFLLAAVAALAIFAAIIGLGYVFRDRIPPPPLTPWAAGMIVAVGLAATWFVLRLAGATGNGPTLRPSARRLRKRALAARQRVVAEHRQRLATLAADPIRRRYVALMEAGEYWSDEQIAYDLDPDRTVTCPHLAPIERAMRVAGVRVRCSVGRWATADCRVDPSTLARGMPVAPEVRYSDDVYAGGRYAEDPMGSALVCDACRSAITVVAPHEAKPSSRWFPHPPA